MNLVTVNIPAPPEPKAGDLYTDLDNTIMLVDFSGTLYVSNLQTGVIGAKLSEFARGGLVSAGYSRVAPNAEVVIRSIS